MRVFFGWSLDNEWDRSCSINANSSNYNDPNELRYCDSSGQLTSSQGIPINAAMGTVSGVPYRNELKANGNIPLKWGFEVALAEFSGPMLGLYTYNNTANVTNTAYNAFTETVQGFQGVNWTVTPTTKYPTDCNCATPGQLVDPNIKGVASEVIQLVAPGTQLRPRIQQTDVTIRWGHHIREKYSIQGELTMFNMFNQSAALAQGTTLGSSAKTFMDSAECSAVGNPTGCGLGGAPTTITNPRMFRVSLQFKF